MREANHVAGRRVVVTRPESREGPLTTAIRLAGAKPVHLPLLRIDPVRFNARVARDLIGYANIVFTSANGVSYFAEQLTEEALSVFTNHPGIVVIGPATGRTVSEYGARPSIAAPEHIAESLVSAMGDVRGKRVLWPRAQAVRPALAARLGAGGAIVIELVVYRTVAEVPLHAAQMVEGADAVTFTSPSGVRAWAGALGKPPMRVICIGPVTARAAEASGFSVAAVADPYTVDGVVGALRRAFNHHRSSCPV